MSTGPDPRRGWKGMGGMRWMDCGVPGSKCWMPGRVGRGDADARSVDIVCGAGGGEDDEGRWREGSAEGAEQGSTHTEERVVIYGLYSQCHNPLRTNAEDHQSLGNSTEMLVCNVALIGLCFLQRRRCTIIARENVRAKSRPVESWCATGPSPLRRRAQGDDGTLNLTVWTMSYGDGGECTTTVASPFQDLRYSRCGIRNARPSGSGEDGTSWAGPYLGARAIECRQAPRYLPHRPGGDGDSGSCINGRCPRFARFVRKSSASAVSAQGCIPLDSGVLLTVPCSPWNLCGAAKGTAQPPHSDGPHWGGATGVCVIASKCGYGAVAICG
ncbi:hypothetical protein C8Q77DRAFT_369292 [Trametes polyzona]|nr:hypothetical protein C8Q77DRAFT_369292 [Trametes polyzona]